MSESQSIAPTSSPSGLTVPSASWTSSLRPVEADVHPLFVERWSPRAFEDEPVAPEALRSLFEAARWAPSSANEQPWLFVYATTPAERAQFLPALLPMNRAWAERAPVLVFLFARKRFTQAGPFQGKPNPTALFDAGAAWMSLAAQAHLLGLSTHAMGGIDRAEASRRLGVSADEYEAVIGIAIGRRASPSTLAEPLASREVPSARRPLAEIAHQGPFESRT
jgi:nitroreductase